MKVRKTCQWIDMSLHFKTWWLTNFSFKVIIILLKSLSSLSLVLEESLDFILTEGINHAIQNYRYWRAFVVLVLTDANKCSQ